MMRYQRIMEVKMVRDTVHRVGKHIQILASKRVPISVTFDLLGRRARSLEELVVIEVMREVVDEMGGIPQQKAS